MQSRSAVACNDLVLCGKPTRWDSAIVLTGNQVNAVTRVVDGTATAAAPDGLPDRLEMRPGSRPSVVIASKMWRLNFIGKRRPRNQWNRVAGQIRGRDVDEQQNKERGPFDLTCKAH